MTSTRQRRSWYRIVAVALSGGLAVILAACKPWYEKDADTKPLSALVVWSGSQCAITATTPVVYWVTDPAQLRKVLAKPTAVVPLDGSGKPAVSLPNVDLANNSLVVVGLGQKPTGGYGLELGAKGVQMNGGQMEVQVRTFAPDADARVAQMLTSPCMVVQVPKMAISGITVIDHTGRKLVDSGMAYGATH